MSYPAIQPSPVTPAPPPTRAGRPPGVTVASLLLWVMGAAGLIYAITTLAVVPGVVDRFRGDRGAFQKFNGGVGDSYVAMVWLGAAVGLALAIIVFALYIVLGLGLRRGSNAARIATLVLSVLGALGGIAAAVTVGLERSGEEMRGSVGESLTNSYPGGWVSTNVGLAIAQTLGYVLVAVLILTASREFFGRPASAATPQPAYGLPYPTPVGYAGGPAYPAGANPPGGVPGAHGFPPPGAYGAPGYGQQPGGTPGSAVPAYGPPAGNPGYGPSAPGNAGQGGAPGGYGPPASGVPGYGPPASGPPGYGAPVPGAAGYGPPAGPPGYGPRPGFDPSSGALGHSPSGSAGPGPTPGYGQPYPGAPSYPPAGPFGAPYGGQPDSPYARPADVPSHQSFASPASAPPAPASSAPAPAHPGTPHPAPEHHAPATSTAEQFAPAQPEPAQPEPSRPTSDPSMPSQPSLSDSAPDQFAPVRPATTAFPAVTEQAPSSAEASRAPDSFEFGSAGDGSPRAGETEGGVDATGRRGEAAPTDGTGAPEAGAGGSGAGERTEK